MCANLTCVAQYQYRVSYEVTALLVVSHHSKEITWWAYVAEMKLPVSHAACEALRTPEKSPSALLQLGLQLGVIEF